MRAAVALGLLLAQAAAQGTDAAAPTPPAVLLIGDVSLNNHFQNAQKALKDEAEVTRSPLGHLSTGAALARIDEVLQGRRWDLICVNFGLNDLMCHDPRSAQVRAMSPAAGGVPVTPLAKYGDNLERLVDRLHQSTHRILWLTTMPLNPRQRSGAISAADVAPYNAVASQRMAALGVEVVDLHAQVTDALQDAKHERERNHQHHLLFKKDLSKPLVDAVLAVPTESIHDAARGAHCERCKTTWGAADLRTCWLHKDAGVTMDPRCDHCRYHGAYKFLFRAGLSAELRQALQQGDRPARRSQR